MANAFNKEERVAFEDAIEGFEDTLAAGKLARLYTFGDRDLERSGDEIWRPMPYVMTSADGIDQTAQFKDKTQLSVPCALNVAKSATYVLTAQELRDANQQKLMALGAAQRLASDINQAVIDCAGSEGTLVIKRGTPTGFDDVAAISAVAEEQGLPMANRVLALSPRDYLAMASSLANAQRSLDDEIASKALRKAYVGDMADWQTFRQSYTPRLQAAAGGGSITMSTLDGATNFLVPRATETVSGRTHNVDNRTQTITVTATAGVVAGDSFTIANVFSMHQVAKVASGQLKTFRVREVVDGTHLVISPPIISGQGATEAEAQYQNVSISTKSATAALVFLNTTAVNVSPFWTADAIEIMPSRYAPPANAGAEILVSKTSQGVPVSMERQYDIKTKKTFYRFDVLFGVNCVAPEMAGILLLGQS